MRIITGELRGRKLETPLGYSTRPTSDKVKEAMFNIIMADTYGYSFVDLFSGTGNLGLEALSRGASECLFCDSSRDAISLIKKNISICGCEDKSKVVAGDYLKALRSLREKVHVFLIDPPYDSGYYEKALSVIDELDLLESDGIILCEHDFNNKLPVRIGRLHLKDERRYGKVGLSIYRLDEIGEENE